MRPVAALQATLAAEHAAVYAYAVVGGRLAATDNPVTADRLRAAYDAHRGRRDQLRSLIAGLGRTPAEPEVAYRVDAEDRDPRSLVAVARQVEERCAAVYSQLVASTTDDPRRLGIDALTETALRLLDLGADPAAYPGLPEL